LKYIATAEGGGEIGYEDLDLDNQLDHNDGEQEAERTQPFQPGAASTPYQPGTPYHGGEQTEMHTCSTSSPACLTLLIPRHHFLEKIPL